ncbi:MAG: OB-fold domain-containing protein [Acidimicrobiales bacterium]|nr:OB-fold domain-containing protein [Acidimicrobiales bacterium]
MSDTTPLQAPLVIEYPFTRTIGPVQSAFLTGLREQVVLGVRRGDGTVLVPPVEYDHDTAEELTELVEVSETGTIQSWAWEPAPDERQPLDDAFAWALVLLDGADTPLLHVVDAPSIDAVETGARVRIRWADEREGSITDIACFELENA